MISITKAKKALSFLMFCARSPARKTISMRPAMLGAAEERILFLANKLSSVAAELLVKDNKQE